MDGRRNSDLDSARDRDWSRSCLGFQQAIQEKRLTVLYIKDPSLLFNNKSIISFPAEVP